MNPSEPASQLEWTDAYLLGYAPMDKVHHEFVESVAAMQHADDAQLLALLDAFTIHAQAHFDSENAWMVQTDFPARECHINEHAAVMRSVEQVRALVAAGNFAVCRKLAAELAAWFPAHTDYLDSALAHWMCKQRLGGKPVVIRRHIAPTRSASTAPDARHGQAPNQ